MGEIKERFGTRTIQVAVDGDASFLRDDPAVARLTEYPNYLEIEPADAVTPERILQRLIERVRVRRFEVVSPSLHRIFVEHVKAVSKLWLVTRKELHTMARTTGYRIATVAGPFLFVALLLVPVVLERLIDQASEGQTVALVAAGPLLPAIRAELTPHGITVEEADRGVCTGTTRARR